MVHFSESYAGGFFGFGRTYGAVARFVCESRMELEAEWPIALAETARWRAGRRERATSLHLDFEASAAWIWDAVEFVKARMIVTPASLAQELRGLFLRVHVFTPDVEHYLYVELFPEATTEHAAEQSAAADGRRAGF
jgi:hypothetical protein